MRLNTKLGKLGGAGDGKKKFGGGIAKEYEGVGKKLLHNT